MDAGDAIYYALYNSRVQEYRVQEHCSLNTELPYLLHAYIFKFHVFPSQPPKYNTKCKPALYIQL